jgi:hypothetical protein
MTTSADPKFTSNGVPITDELIERLAAEAEAGYDPDQLRPASARTLRALGIAPDEDELTVPILRDLRTQLRERAKAEHSTEAELVHRALTDFLHRAS